MKGLREFLGAPIGGAAIAIVLWYALTDECAIGSARCGSDGNVVEPTAFLAAGGLIGLFIGFIIYFAQKNPES